MHDTDPAAEYEIDPRLLEVLVCPLTRGPLTYDRVNHELISHQARKAYPVRAGDDMTNDELADDPGLFETGCAGRLSFFQESDDGRFVIALNGV